VSEWILNGTIRLYSAIHVVSHWKIQDRRQIKNTDSKLTETKTQSRKANNAKHSKRNYPASVAFTTLGQ